MGEFLDVLFEKQGKRATLPQPQIIISILEMVNLPYGNEPKEAWEKFFMSKIRIMMVSQDRILYLEIKG